MVNIGLVVVKKSTSSSSSTIIVSGSCKMWICYIETVFQSLNHEYEKKWKDGTECGNICGFFIYEDSAEVEHFKCNHNNTEEIIAANNWRHCQKDLL